MPPDLGQVCEQCLMDLVDRLPDFYRRRLTRCAACGHEQSFDDDWFERWSHREELCPGCGVDCTSEDATRVEADPADPALNDSLVLGLSWWHTSTHADWPPANVDPAARLDEPTRHRMGGDEAVARWVVRQNEKALHVGSYEAAVQNMLRRIHNQGDLGQTFYLYRVRLRPDLAVRAGCSGEVVDFVGDVALRDVCPAGIDAARYVNSHEDPGGISLALGRDAVHSVQRLRLPLDNSSGASWRESAMERLTAASSQPVAVIEPDNELTRLRRRFNGGPTMTSRRMQGQTRILHEVTAHLPTKIRRQVRAAVSVDDTADPAEWCDSLASIMQLIDDPEVVVLAARETTSTPVRDR